MVDSVFLPLMVDRPVTFSAKAEYFTASGPAARLWAAYLKSTNQLRMDREGPRAAQETLEAALALLLEGKLFGIYPEGTRSPDGRLYRGRPGVGWLALKSGLPVIPVALSGTRRVLPPGHVVPRPGRIGVTIGQPLVIAPELAGEPPGQARRLIADQVMAAIQKLSGQEYVPMFASDRKAALARPGLRPRAAGPGHTLTRIARGMTSNVAGVVPRISPSASIGRGGSASIRTRLARSSAMWRCGRCVPR